MILQKINIIFIGCEISKEFVPKKMKLFLYKYDNEKQYIFPFLKSILFPNYDKEKQYMFPFLKSMLFHKQ